MTAALLAAYPDIFAGGAVAAGLPVGAAGSVSEAMRRMAEAGPVRSPAEWADRARRVAPPGYSGPWPRLSIWHGDGDHIVNPANAGLLAAQWCALHGLDAAAIQTQELPGMQHSRWTVTGQPVLERWRLHGLTHLWPPEAAERIAGFWGIAAD